MLSEAAFSPPRTDDGDTTCPALGEDVLTGHTYNGPPLPREHGGPVRMSTPQRCAWMGTTEKGWTQYHAYDDLYLEQGGRERGFRTFAYVTHPRPGDWCVSMETEDGREIGRLSFTVTPDASTAPRQFKAEAG